MRRKFCPSISVSTINSMCTGLESKPTLRSADEVALLIISPVKSAVTSTLSCVASNCMIKIARGETGTMRGDRGLLKSTVSGLRVITRCHN
jgi:hypothetical protein